MRPLREYTVGGFRVSEFIELGSTNDYLKKLAAEGEPDGAVAIALSQSGGRGRLGRSFFSPESGLYMSVLLRRGIPVSLAHLITPLAAVAVSEALEKTGSERAGIKWVNDIYIGGRKVCGILTETHITSDGRSLDYAIIGIGINIKAPKGGFPDDIKYRAGAAFDDPDEGTREQLADNILKSLERHLSRLGERAFVSAYRERSVLIGREVEIAEPSGSITARVIDIDGDCKLRVETPEGVREIFAGEVSVRL